MKTIGQLAGFCFLLSAFCFPALGQPSVKVNQKAEAYSGVQLLSLSTNVTTVWATNNLSSTTGRVLYRGIQNTGTNPFLYLIGSTNVSATNFTGVAAGGQAVRDGLGSIVDLSRVPWPVSLKTESGETTASAVELTQ